MSKMKQDGKKVSGLLKTDFLFRQVCLHCFRPIDYSKNLYRIIQENSEEPREQDSFEVIDVIFKVENKDYRFNVSLNHHIIKNNVFQANPIDKNQQLFSKITTHIHKLQMLKSECEERFVCMILKK